jgi:hypothetical protein
MNVVVSQLNQQGVSYAAQLANEKEARKKDADAAREIIGYQRARILDLNELILKLGDMVRSLQGNVNGYRAREMENIGRIRLLAKHRKVLFGDTVSPNSQEVLCGIFTSLKSLDVPDEWVTQLPSEPVDTAPLPTIPEDSSAGSLPPGAPNVAGGE